MLTFHRRGEAVIVGDDLKQCQSHMDGAVWVDLIEPTRDEEAAIEASLGFDVPTVEEMKQLELSQRLYRDGERLFMTATVLTRADTDTPASSPITFILSPQNLVTVRYEAASPVATFSKRWEGSRSHEGTPLIAMVGLVDALVERLADILEAASARYDAMSTEVFRPNAAGPERRDYREVLERLGRNTDLVSRAKESLTSLGRLVGFLQEAVSERPGTKATVAHLNTVTEDLIALGEHVTFLMGKATFLLDATLGLISNEQNGIIKLVSVLALVFGPPTLVASIYGMNFETMPELKWTFGYPLALVFMVVSAILPYAFFKHRRWL